MRKVRIDFAPPSLRRAILRAPREAWLLLLALFIMCGPLLTAVTKYRKGLDERARLQAATEVHVRQAAAGTAPAPSRAPLPAAQAAAVNAAVLQLNLPWRGLHDAVQSATPANIALLALEPDAKKSALRITAEAKSSDDMIAYVARLQQEDWFKAVALVRHEINEQDPNRPIRFQIDARWQAAP
ncbi:PilN domain-containing protein [Massilia forsythiae]|uniref:PilN domain-containing protein n=1 Tax=Massilia forsythiae TaxID=2728020 RepID=A0A7Z2VSQ7_9BURK|nr:PilN domain-containing protein [Massilia forsythiae]QJD98762.1 PilN domain-containing protein [Massilia forsythiae]